MDGGSGVGSSVCALVGTARRITNPMAQTAYTPRHHLKINEGNDLEIMIGVTFVLGRLPF
jgi:hypothetical protein